MTPVPALPAATVTLVRDGAAGLEVLMLQRNFKSGFMPGMYLFPGGGLDAGHLSRRVRCVGHVSPYWYIRGVTPRCRIRRW